MGRRPQHQRREEPHRGADSDGDDLGLPANSAEAMGKRDGIFRGLLEKWEFQDNLMGFFLGN